MALYRVIDSEVSTAGWVPEIGTWHNFPFNLVNAILTIGSYADTPAGHAQAQADIAAFPVGLVIDISPTTIPELHLQAGLFSLILAVPVGKPAPVTCWRVIDIGIWIQGHFGLSFLNPITNPTLQQFLTFPGVIYDQTPQNVGFTGYVGVILGGWAASTNPTNTLAINMLGPYPIDPVGALAAYNDILAAFTVGQEIPLDPVVGPGPGKPLTPGLYPLIVVRPCSSVVPSCWRIIQVFTQQTFAVNVGWTNFDPSAGTFTIWVAAAPLGDPPTVFDGLIAPGGPYAVGTELDINPVVGPGPGPVNIPAPWYLIIVVQACSDNPPPPPPPPPPPSTEQFPYQLTFANIPFVSDRWQELNIGKGLHEGELAPFVYDPLPHLYEELNRMMPFQYLSDFDPPDAPNRNLSAIANLTFDHPLCAPDIQIGQWYYPTGASKWSVFRGLMTSAMVQALMDATSGLQSGATFIMDSRDLNFTTKSAVQTVMFALPPRSLGEMGGQFDGLYLVTLVDERYYFRGTSITIHIADEFEITTLPATNLAGDQQPVYRCNTWADIIEAIGSTLGIAISYSAIDAVYSLPERDSALWANVEDAGLLLDAVAYNIGRRVVRNLDGTYTLMKPDESAAIVATNRGSKPATVYRTAGGEIFCSGSMLPVGDLMNARNAVVPNAINFSFPFYVIGNDPVPHSLNSRTTQQRGTAWYEDGYGDTFSLMIPITSGGAAVSGLRGTSTNYIHSTAKALISGEVQTTPLNASGLTAMAMQLASDAYAWNVQSAVDETYPGCWAWVPEGIHDILWTYSERLCQGSTRAFHPPFNQGVLEMQHAAPAMSGFSIVPGGVGGHSVAQTWRDSTSGGIFTTLAATLLAADDAVVFSDISNLPTQNRWRGRIEGELILFEGTSGGVNVDVVYRGIDGTLAADHANGTLASLSAPDTTYGVNLVTAEKGQYFYPQEWSSGGMQGVRVVPQTQTVQVLCDVARSINNIDHFSGRVQLYDTTLVGLQFDPRELCWITERNVVPVVSGKYYDGQFAGFSATPAAPEYAVNEYPPGSGAVTSGVDTECIPKCPVRVVLNESIGAGFTWDGNTLITADAVGNGPNIDGIDFTNDLGTRILVNFIVSPGGSPNAGFGIYNLVSGGGAAKKWQLKRATDWNQSTQVNPGGANLVPVQQGNQHGDSVWTLEGVPMSGGTFVISTTPIAFCKVAQCGSVLSSGTINMSGQIIIGSGQIKSGMIGSGAVIIGSGFVIVPSGYVEGYFGTRMIASGTVGVYDFGSGAVIIGSVGSGAIVSGNIGMAQVGTKHIAVDAIQSGLVASGAIIGQAGGGEFSIASGTISRFDHGSGAINSGHIASGAIIGYIGGVLGAARTIASGTVGTYDAGSGATFTRSFFGGPYFSGTAFTARCEELISGIQPVCLSESGTLRVAMASVSGRMPAVGVVFENNSSGLTPDVYYAGVFPAPGSFSGRNDYTLIVGRSGGLVSASGSLNSGGLFQQSGDVYQAIGMPCYSGMVAIQVSPPQPLLDWTRFVPGTIVSGIQSGTLPGILLASGALGSIGVQEVTLPGVYVTAEIISGDMAVALSSGNTLVLAQAGSGLRMPAIAVNKTATFASGLLVGYTNWVRLGVLPSTIIALISGHVGESVYVGSGGMVVTSGGMASGMMWQRLGVAGSGTILVDIDLTVVSGPGVLVGR